jgi:hypothetical protein
MQGQEFEQTEDKLVKDIRKRGKLSEHGVEQHYKHE